MTRPPRDDGEFYPTPEGETERFLRRTFARTVKPPKTILEPAAGAGVMVRALRAQWPDAEVDAFDVEPQGDGIEQRMVFLDDTPKKYDLIFTNPPFSWMQGYASWGLEKLDSGGALVLLGPVAFWESETRYEFNRRRPPHHTYVLKHRVSFTEDGKTDSRALAWFVWRENGGRPYASRISVL